MIIRRQRAIANQAGIEAGAVTSGDELETLSDEVLAAAMKTTSVFARIHPAEAQACPALKRDGEIVAMTGDGVNDAPR